jgi:hypothetical protein
MTNDLTFAWPEGLLGRSSAWVDQRDAALTILHPPFARRREVYLERLGRGLRIPIAAGYGVADDQLFHTKNAHSVDILIKTSTPSSTALRALSSGASSALVPEADYVVRLKRCGFAEIGVGQRLSSSSSPVLSGRIGLMTLAEAIQECRMLRTFRSQGLCPACDPLSIDLLADPSLPYFYEQAYAVSRIRVDSDVRADEWLLKMVIDEITKETGQDLVDVRDGEYISVRMPMEVSFLLSRGHLAERVADLGRGLGGLMRATHDAGLLRGRGSVWFGNDVVGPEGLLSAVDADGGARDSNDGAEHAESIEVFEYAAGFADCVSWGQPDWLAGVAAVLNEAFYDGYRSAAEPRLRAPCL